MPERANSLSLSGRTLAWLHLSDWHQAEGDFDREVVRDRLLEDIRQRRDISSDLVDLSFIVFSGDVANTGKAREYGAAIEHLFDPLLECTGVSRDRLFVVPGNHDLDRNQFEFLPPALLRPLDSSEEVNKWLTDPKRRSHLLEPLEAYCQFTTDYLGVHQEYGFSSTFEAAGQRIGIVGLNSALLCGRNLDNDHRINDYGHLVVGEPQIHHALEKTADADLRIAVMHHPFQWLAQFDADLVQERLATACHFVLCGHQHTPKADIVRGTTGDCIIVPAGASYNRRIADNPRYTNSYNFTAIDVERAVAVLYLRRWSERRNRWVADTDSADGGRLVLPLPKQPAKGSTNGPAVVTRRRRGAFWKSREFMLIPESSFFLGSTEERALELLKQDRNHPFLNECPRHEIYLKSFLISRYPVTNKEYREFVLATQHPVPYRDDHWSRPMNWDPDSRTYPAGRDDHPVVLVSWYDAEAYCRWLGARLPTEAEWEKAARGPKGWEWPWGDSWQKNRCNAGESIFAGTKPVGHYKARGESFYGVNDLVGNVWEWCSSHSDPYPYDSDDGREEAAAQGQRVQRGGAWDVSSIYARCAIRAVRSPEDFGFNVGFRLALDPL